MKWLAFIPPGGSQANAAAFQVQTGAGFVAGTPVDLQVTVTSDQGGSTNYLRLFTGQPGTDVLFNNYFHVSAGAAGAIEWFAVVDVLDEK